MDVIFPFTNSYARLPERFFSKVAPTPVRSPTLLKINEGLARELGVDPEKLGSAAGVAALAGNVVPAGAEPLAQVYAGHQFGGWSPRLGDGRAILLGEVIDASGRRRDVQLKGAGPTPYSRGGDGRAWLGPVLREYVVSEAMYALGVPTTRALAAVSTGEPVYRERALPGAVLTRVAASHVRVGTLQYFAGRGDEEGLRALVEYVIARHFPGAEGALGLLEAVIAAQARLVAAWMSVGFIHGVMNTDNTLISGETIDYGPCAFMDGFDPKRVFSSIDGGGRYAYSNQPQVMLWNLAQLANALLPLMGERGAAIEAATAALAGFSGIYQAAWLARFRAKLGLMELREGDLGLIEGLLGGMAAQKADFTRTLRGLAEGTAGAEFADPAVFEGWAAGWRARLAEEGATPEARAAALRAANPGIIPRNHRIEEAIAAAVKGELGPFERLVEALSRPFEEQPAHAALMAAPRPEEVVRATFCGT